MPNDIPAKTGLNQTVIDQINHVFAQFPCVESAIIFGSRAKGNFRTGSDIDLAVTGTKITPQQLLNIEKILDDLPLPYTIDLVWLEKITNKDLSNHINRVGLPLYQQQTVPQPNRLDGLDKTAGTLPKLSSVIELSTKPRL